MESCRSVFLAILYSVMTRRPRCVVASGRRVRQHPAAALIGFLFVSEINIKKKGPPRVVTNGDPSRRHRDFWGPRGRWPWSQPSPPLGVPAVVVAARYLLPFYL